jgi:hypothetical protein
MAQEIHGFVLDIITLTLHQFRKNRESLNIPAILVEFRTGGQQIALGSF